MSGLDLVASMAVRITVTGCTMVRVAILVATMMLVALPASAEVFRCETDGIIEFSDTTCQPDAQPYISQAAIVVGRPLLKDEPRCFR